MSRFANNELLGGGVKVRVWIREQRKIKGTTKPLLAVLDISHFQQEIANFLCVLILMLSCKFLETIELTQEVCCLAFPSGFMVLVCGFDYHLQSTGVCLEGFGFKHCSEIHRYVCNQCVISMHIHIP